MTDKNKIVKVTNRFDGSVGYSIPDLSIDRKFIAGESKEVTFEELYKLTNIPGGERILKHYLVVNDEEVVKELFNNVEPEYFYSREDVKKLMTTGSLDEFLDCLDFAPDGVIEMIKDLAVSLPLNDVEKRKAILKKTGFNVTNAITIKETKYDGDAETSTEEDKDVAPKRRVSANEENKSGRRATPPKYKVVE